MKIQIPDTAKGQQAIVKVKDVWFTSYYRNGKVCRHSLKTSDKKEAFKLRNKFFSFLLDEGASVYKGRNVNDKLQNKPELYIYKRKPFIFKIKNKVIGEFDTYEEALLARSSYLENL
jgi:hypothetical protein